MKSFFQSLAILASFPLIFIGCEGRQTEVTPAANNDRAATMLPPPATRLLQAPAKIEVFELAPEALPVWRNFRQEKPALIILSDDPFLLPIPDPQRTEVERLVEAGNSDDFKSRAKQQIASPALLPAQTLSAALNAHFFSRILWIVPSKPSTKDLDLDTFRSQMVEAYIMGEKEASELTMGNGIIHGQLRDTPFLATHIGNLPQIDEPVVLHLDLSYFSKAYDNEVSTPLFQMVSTALHQLRQTGWKTSAITLSPSTEEGQVPLNFRFLNEILAGVFRDPGMLDTAPPAPWGLRNEALYLETFFQPEQVFDLYQRLASLQPDSASVQFDLYRTLRTLKDYEESYKHLKQAVSADPGYAWEYNNLANHAIQWNQLDEAVAFLETSSTFYPMNPFIKLVMAQCLIAQGEKKRASELLTQLKAETWSPIYYPEFPAALPLAKD